MRMSDKIEIFGEISVVAQFKIDKLMSPAADALSQTSF